MSSSRGFRQNDGDWTCPECNNLNFARRMQCNRCGVERKFEVKKTKKGGIEIGKLAAEKSKGLFSADDWMCKTCGNVNWARRNECNMCNTPKVNVQEERTGYGGGFNERDGIEYKEKEDSDGELDEFGRKKKKYRAKIPQPREAVTNSDDEDDDESGDDEDVSKYDLGADEEDEDDGDASKYDLAASDDDEDSHRSRSRSRSRSSSRSRKNGRSSSSSTSRSRSHSGSRRHRSRSYSSSSNSSDSHKNHRKRRRRSRSRTRSRSPHYPRKRSRSREFRDNRR